MNRVIRRRPPRIRSIIVFRHLLTCIVICNSVGCDFRKDTRPLFSTANGLTLVAESRYNRRSGLTGDGIEFRAWKISGDRKVLENLISPFEISNRLVWLKSDDIRINEGFSFLTRFDEFRTLLPAIRLALQDPDVRVAFEDMFASERGIEGCSMWICSPQGMTLIYVSAKG